MSTTSNSMSCVTCQLALGANYWRRDDCGHHQCARCAVPCIKANKTYCHGCEAPARPTANMLGALVLGTDSEQIARVAKALRAEREVRLRSNNASITSMFVRNSSKSIVAAPAVVRRCRAARDVDGCAGGVMCVHDVYDVISRAAMRAACEYRGIERKFEQEWTQRVKALLEHKPKLSILGSAGVTCELLAYCKMSLHDLVWNSGYLLEDVIETFKMRFADLRLLGFNISFLNDKANYPLIVLYEKAGVRADDIFSFDMSFAVFKRYVLDVDKRYEVLLDVNLVYWRRILGGSK